MSEPLVLNRYRLIERLATGGSAEVWRAHDEQLARPVAVKRLHPHLLPDEASRKRLAAEARAVAGLSHPVILSVYDVDVTGEAPALVMELVDGESLAARIERDGPLPEREAVRITADLADALYHAHQQGVIHRDVKPGNVLLARDGGTRLVDFGIAHSLASSADRLTLAGSVIGTLRAMAPEQLAGGPIGPRTDLYGLGVVLHEALLARPPYPEVAPVALAEAQRAGPPPLEGIDPALAALITSCLSHDPTDRPLHAGAVAAALRGWLEGDASAALAMAPPAAAIERSAVTQQVPTVPVEASSTPHRRAWSPIGAWLGVAGLAGLALAWVMLGGFAAIGSNSSPTPSPTVMAEPTPIPTPAWMAELLAEVLEECGQPIADEVEAEILVMDEDTAKDHVDEVIEECEDDDDSRPGRGRGRGNDNGGGGDD